MTDPISSNLTRLVPTVQARFAAVWATCVAPCVSSTLEPLAKVPLAKTGLTWESDVTAVGGKHIFPCNRNQGDVKLWTLSFFLWNVRWNLQGLQSRLGGRKRGTEGMLWWKNAPCFVEWVQFWDVWCLGNRLLWFRRLLQICARQAGRLFSLPSSYSDSICNDTCVSVSYIA